MLLISLLLILSSTTNDVISACEFGVPHEVTSYTVNRYGSSSGTQVYLGLENSASCGGCLRNYTICQLNRIVGRTMTPGNLSIWEPAVPFIDGLKAFSKIKSSDIQLPLAVNNTCGVDPTVTPLNPSTPLPAREVICFQYCFPENSAILVRPGSVPGITYPNGITYSLGQILSINTRQTEGLCVGGNHRLSLGDLVEVTCPLSPANLTTGLLAGAGIEPIYCPGLSLQYGSINISGPYSYGTGIEYTCQTGFHLVGVSSQTCLSSGDWSDELPYCNVLNCTDPGVPSNGNCVAVTNGFNNGSLIVFSCDNDFTLRGSESILCYYGSWTASVPECVHINNTEAPTTVNKNNGVVIVVGLTVSTISVILVVILIITLVIVIVMFKSKINNIEKRNATVNMIRTEESPAYNVTINNDDMQYNKAYIAAQSLEQDYAKIEDSLTDEQTVN
ncbi:PREDICTED: uncharacterized protein LOC109584228 isoform X2 [Amphimedon queenslandica]|uniref:Sushi domain-containing protein n=1 Tax=Amphimedon queenslandica TaxID=400682 RepID=A0AAN0JEK9_AMPQE|nr:PREDICTED: uncharacterized protein LOC109584228 isoform X2 [Amphimedon queenslandica]|eukprot:XP_019855455.1 PREDICTED: uncharacterized protein LOC109584228 isoform X2 [Amphimedon queenslandica]